jgi:hypothetical protein
VVSLIAMVPESECRTPTLIGSCAWSAPDDSDNDATAPNSARRVLKDFGMGFLRQLRFDADEDVQLSCQVPLARRTVPAICASAYEVGLDA